MLAGTEGQYAPCMCAAENSPYGVEHVQHWVTRAAWPQGHCQGQAAVVPRAADKLVPLLLIMSLS